MDEVRSRAFRAGTASIGEARRFVKQSVMGWPVAKDDLVLVASELATNALRHGGGGFDLKLRRKGSEVILEVQDRVASKPVILAAEVQSSTGRGLLIVDHIAQSWGVRELPGQGKVVWARFKVMQ